MSLVVSRLFGLLIFLIGIAGCAPIQSTIGLPETTPEQARTDTPEGRLQTAEAWWQRSFRQVGEAREDLQLQAIELLLTPETRSQARIYIDQIIEARLTNPGLWARKDIAQATLLLYENRPEEALRLLPAVESVPRAQGLRVLELRAQALSATGAIKPGLDVRMQLATHLTERKALADNEVAIWNTLKKASTDDVYQWAAETTDETYRGWLALAYIEKSSASVGELEQRWREWEQRYPSHPARGRIAMQAATRTLTPVPYGTSPESSPAPADGLQTQPYASGPPLEQPYPGQTQAPYGVRGWSIVSGQAPRQIAVLLPQSGSYANVAQAVLAGLYTAYYQDQGESQGIELRVYDAGENASQVRSQYDRALSEGADFVVGPLVKEAVIELAGSGPLPVPALSLNYLDVNTTGAPNLYQFGLLPEDEARQAAERASADGHRTALSFVPESEWGARLEEAFRVRFSELGGTVLNATRYDTEAADFSPAIRAALALDASDARHRELQSLLGSEIKFEPTRRQDADLIFLAAAPRQARLLNPQFKFHFAGDLPIYATSHLYGGQEDAPADRDLSGIIYCDIPWLITPDAEGLALKQRLEQLYPEAARQFPRLAALGIDAYRLIPQLYNLQNRYAQDYEGVTGSLSVTPDGRVHRALQWGRFVDGKPLPLEAGAPIEPVFELEQDQE